MRTLAFFVKTTKENLRDWKILILALVFAPMFVYLFYAYMNGSGAPTYTVAVLDLDRQGPFSAELVRKWKGIVNSDGKPVLNVRAIANAEAGKRMVKNKTADLMTTIPSDFSSSFFRFLDTRQGAISSLANYGDPANMKYLMAASFCDYTTYGYVAERTGTAVPLDITFEAAGSARSQSEFDLFFPALLVFSLIMVLFTAAATLVREVEKGTITRLILSKLSPLEMLGAVSLNQLIIGAACLLLTYLAGLSVGYRSSGSLALLILVGAATCFSVIAMSIITAHFIKSMFGLLTVGCFPFFVLMFFSDCFMPLPKFTMFSVLGNPVFVNDVLPTAVATRAFNKILNLGAGFSDIWFELLCIVSLSLLYFAIGAILFQRKHMAVSV